MSYYTEIHWDPKRGYIQFTRGHVDVLQARELVRACVREYFQRRKP